MNTSTAHHTSEPDCQAPGIRTGQVDRGRMRHNNPVAKRSAIAPGAANSGLKRLAWATMCVLAMLCIACSTTPHAVLAVPGALPAPSFEQIQSSEILGLPAGKTLSISNPFGDIHVRQSADASLHLSLFLQRTQGSQAQARIAQKSSRTSLNLAVSAEQNKFRNSVLRIDLVVLIPQQARVTLTTKHGMIDVKKINNPLVDAISDSGELRITTRGVMHARSKTGRIRATIMQPGWSGESRMSSDSGLVQVFFPLSPNLHLLATTGAAMRSEFELQIVQNGKCSRVEVNQGDGSDTLVVASRDGEVELYSVVFNPADYPPPPAPVNDPPK